MKNGFLWGVAAASYQIEGAVHEGGRGESIWDRFSHTPGKVLNGDTGDIAIDHFHRIEEDVQLMVDLGVNAYRFSIAWPRLFPSNSAVLEPQGVDFYNKLINTLVANGIEPVATLYHWDLPQYLEDIGGWATRETVFAFENYARTCAELFGDRIEKWITLNEPWCTSFLGYYMGIHAPGVKNASAAIAAAHHTALAHGYATRAIKSVRPDAKVGITVNMTNLRTDSDDQETRHNWELVDANQNRWWIDAFTKGEYPKALVEEYGVLLSQVIEHGDFEVLKVENDFLGVNYYCDGFVGKARATDRPMNIHSPYPINRIANMELPNTEFETRTDFNWPVTPEGLGNLVLRINRDWPEIKSIYITENGAAFNDGPNEYGEIEDARRVDYIHSHLESLRSAIEQGAPVDGYFAWSLWDNFEWAEGYSKRFGIVYVDFETLKRTPKQSFHMYKKYIAESHLELKV